MTEKIVTLNKDNREWTEGVLAKYDSLDEIVAGMGKIDDAFAAIERENDKLKGIIQRISGFSVNEETLIGLIDLFSDTHFTQPSHNGDPINLAAKDILGHVYEYFLGEFARAEGKKGGQFFTPKSIVTLIVEMLEPYQGRVYDPAMGFRVIIVIEANSYVNIRSLRLLPKFKTQKINSWCAA